MQSIRGQKRDGGSDAKWRSRSRKVYKTLNVESLSPNLIILSSTSQKSLLCPLLPLDALRYFHQYSFPPSTMKYLSALAFAALLGLSAAVAIHEPMHINIDVQIHDDAQFEEEGQHMRPNHAISDSFSVSRLQEVVGLDDPVYDGTYSFLISIGVYEAL